MRPSAPHQAVTLLSDRRNRFRVDLRIHDLMIVLAPSDDDLAFGVDDLAESRIRQPLLLAGLVGADHPELVLVAARGLMDLVLLVRGGIRDMADDFRALEREHPCSFGN